MTHLELVPVPPVAQLAGVSQHYGKNRCAEQYHTRYSGPLHGRADWPGRRREVELVVVDFRCPRH